MNQPPHLQLFTYEGPAAIGGLAFDDVSLHEEPDPFSQHPTPHWKGTAVVPFAAWPPPHFGLPNTPTLEIVLPDGRRSELCAGVEFIDGRWTLDLWGTGPLPT